jgi:hypothetical protein
MVLTSRREYLEAIRKRYHAALKVQKGIILDEFCATCGYHRKHAIRLLRSKSARSQKRRPGAKAVYRDELLLLALKRIWLATDQMCGKKLKGALPLWLPWYDTEFEPLAPNLLQKLLAASPATLDRLLKPLKCQHPKARGATKPGTLLKNQIPVKTHNWDVTQPGYFEADTVAHCGNSLAGDFVYSLTFSDIYSGWTENRATWGRGSHGVKNQVEDIEHGLVFPIRGFDCDNGSEFLNHHLVRYFTERPQNPVAFTRSRPYHKNDNAHVEQKNWTTVRQFLGYDRFDRPELVPLLNDLYKNEWSQMTNFFYPTLKLKEKRRVNSRYVKTYEPPQTPYQRLLTAPDITANAKEKLRLLYNSLNPFILRKSIQTKLKVIFATLYAPRL